MVGPFALLLVLAAAPSGPRDTVYVLPEVRVDRDRAALEVARRRQPTGFVTELPVGVSGRALESLADVMSGAVGARVVQYGGLGAFSTVSLRAAPAGQVAVYLDGAPITSAAHGAVNLAELPVGALERVEVYRGAAPLALGTPTPGGAINLVTVAAPDLLDARLARGSFDTWEGRATAGARRGTLAGLVHVGYQGSRGDYRYADDHGTPFNPADDRISTRVNDRFDAATLLSNLTWRPARRLKVTLREDVFRKAQGLPGLGTVPARNARLAFLRALTQLEADREAVRLVPAIRLRGAVQQERSRFRDLAGVGELGLGRHDTDDHFGGADGALTMQWPALPGGLGLEAGVSARHERAALHDPASPFADAPPSHRSTVGATLGLQWRGLGERLLLRAARRWDRLRDTRNTSVVGDRIQTLDVRRTLNAPQLGARLALGRGLEARANWSDAERAPDFLELFGNQGFVVGNPALRPEHGASWDAGGAWSGTARGLRASLEWAHFDAQPRDLIQYNRLSQSYARAANVSRAHLQGEELTVRLAVPGGATLAAHSTWQSAIDESDVAYLHGKRLPQRPARQGYLRLEAPLAAGHLAVDVQATGDEMLDPYNRMPVPDHTLLGASLGWPARGGRLTFTLEGKNLTDRHVTDVAGYPLPGRSVALACETRLGPAESIHR